MALFGQMTGVKVQMPEVKTEPPKPEASAPKTAEEIDQMTVEEIVTKDLDVLIGDTPGEDVTREENLEKLQQQLNLVLQIENKVKSEKPPASRNVDFTVLKLSKLTLCFENFVTLTFVRTFFNS